MSWSRLFYNEFLAIVKNPAISLTVFVGVIFYSFLYPQPYLNQIPRELSLVVVNLDDNQFSRQLERMVDASPQIAIKHRVTSLKEAQKVFLKERLAGIMVIPENFYRDVLLGKSPVLSYAGDASYFLVYGLVIEGLTYAGETLSAKVRVTRMMQKGLPQDQAIRELSPINLNIKPVFNSTVSYLNYVLPAVFLLILHHTLIIGVAILTGTQKDIDKNGNAKIPAINNYWQEVSVTRILSARFFVFGSIYTLLGCYYFGYCFNLMEIPRIAPIWQLGFCYIPFLFACISLGILLGKILPHKELATFVVLITSLPILFASGYFWPASEVPIFLKMIVQIAPFSPALHASSKLNQLGASLTEVFPYLYQLLAMGIIFLLLTWCLDKRAKKNNQIPHKQKCTNNFKG
ncbi:MAG: ABC transporter permease [Desulfotalea sp.]